MNPLAAIGHIFLSFLTTVGDLTLFAGRAIVQGLSGPFYPRAILRRAEPSQTANGLSPAKTIGDVSIDPGSREVTIAGARANLRSKEFDLLELLIRHPRQVLTRETFYDRIWGYDFSGESNILEVYIRYLRSKLEAAGAPRLIQTVRGVGYALREEIGAASEV